MTIRTRLEALQGVEQGIYLLEGAREVLKVPDVDTPGALQEAGEMLPNLGWQLEDFADWLIQTDEGARYLRGRS